MVVKSSDTPITDSAMLSSCWSAFTHLKKKKETFHKKKNSMLIDKDY